MELAGEGALLKLLEERRKKLTAEGLFDAARKRPLPFLPDVIGVVTSPTGAVIRDILHRLEDRFPRHVLLWPVLVQGEGAARQVAAAIEGFNRLAPGGRVPRPDVLIVARGGGSLEDLWAFNEEIVVRAAAASEIPLISAVGHETDTTLIDFASDRRAPTPTAAAEMAVPVRADLQVMVLDCARRMVACMQRGMDDRRVRVEGLARGLPDLDSLLGNWSQRLDTAGERLTNAGRGFLRDRQQQVLHWAAQIKAPRQIVNESRNKLQREAKALEGAGHRYLKYKEDRLMAFADRLSLELVKRPLDTARRQLKACSDLLESLSYHRVLERGYAVVRDAGGKAVAASAALAAGDAVSIEFADGAVGAQVTGAGPARKPVEANEKPKPATPDRRQGRLL
jgi:exodeoxyribonuclease VII large subunit